MTLRDLLVLGLAFGGLAACSGTTTKDTGDTVPGDDDDGNGDDDDDGTPTADTSTGGGGGDDELEIGAFYFGAQFAFDASTGTLVTATLDGNELGNFIYYQFGTAAWVDSIIYGTPYVDEVCQVTVPLTSAAPAPWDLKDSTTWYGVDFVGTAADVTTECTSPAMQKAYDAYWAGYYLPQEIFALYPPGAGVGETTGVILNYYPDANDTFYDNIFGGRVVDQIYGVPTEDSLARAYEIDPVTYEVVLDGNNLVNVPTADVYNGKAIVTAIYTVDSVFYYGL